MDSRRTLGQTNLHVDLLGKPSETEDGVDSADVDWFLRDSNVSPPDLPPQHDLEFHTKTHTSAGTQLQENSSKGTSISALIPNSHVDKAIWGKSKPSILENEAYASGIQEYSTKPNSPRVTGRRNSASSMGSASSADSSSSTNGFFSKLKTRLSRSDSSSSVTGQIKNKQHSSGKDVQSIPINTSEDILSKQDLRDTNVLGVGFTPSTKDKGTETRLDYYIRLFRQRNQPTSCFRISEVDENNKLTRVSSDNGETSFQHSKFSSLFRKMSISSTQSTANEKVSSSDLSLQRTPSPASSGLSHEIPIDSRVKSRLKHVAFHSQTFLIDPPQQIPSRNPRKGNVEILSSGVIRINPLTEADKEAIDKSSKGQGGGLVVGGTGVLGLIDQDNEPESTKLKEGMESDHSELHRCSFEVKNNALLEHNGISTTFAAKKSSYSAPVKKMALDLMYTRCCHLREILPVPAILKQIPEGSTASLPILQLKNPSPTMIEVLTFADFIRIAPIICISLDGVSLSLDQLNVLLSAMCAKTQLEKLSLRNTPIDVEGWSLLCLFLSKNKVLNRLDITQCPPLSLNLIKKRKGGKSDETSFDRMSCRQENRSDMDWTLFTAALIARGGIEELILTGCCINELPIFETLIKRALSIRTFKLGLAYNRITPEQLSAVLELWFFSENCRGLDLGYNNLSSRKYLEAFLSFGKAADLKDLTLGSKIGFLSLNATNLRFNETFREFFENFVAQLPMLKYLDISNNPRLFGSHVVSHQQSHSGVGSSEVETSNNLKTTQNTISEECEGDSYTAEALNMFFCSRLPRFKSLARLHLENNGLSSRNLRALFEIVPFCKSLNYLSIAGNKLDILSATSLLQCLRCSTSLITVDADYSNLPEMFKEKVGLYSMHNMTHLFNKDIASKIKDGSSSLTKGLSTRSLADSLAHLLARKTDEKLDLSSTEVKSVVKRIQDHRIVLQEALGDLFDLQYKRELNIGGKETLIRLLFVDSALEWALRLVDSSLVEREKDFISSDIINMNSAEDEKSELKASMISRVRNSSLEEHNITSPVNSGSLPVSRQQSFSNLSSLDKEEGSAMKLSRLTNETLFKQLSMTPGEDIRKLLINDNNSDIDGVIANISKARDNGIPMKQLFYESFETREKNLEGSENQDKDNAAKDVSNNSAASSENSHDSRSDIHSFEDGTHKEMSMNETYDEILRELGR